MNCSRRTLAVVIVASILATSSQETFARSAETKQLRFMSMALRDRAPTADEAKAVASGEKSLLSLRDEWLESPEHEARVGRWFADIYAVPEAFFVADDAYFLRENSDGVWHSPVKGSCASNTAVTVSAWWRSSASDTIRMCPNVVSTNMSVTENGQYYGCSWVDGFLRTGCGCGPSQILCWPESVKHTLPRDMANELRDRGVSAYRDDRSWLDAFGGNKIYAHRPMYQYYLLTQYVRGWQAAPNNAEIAKLYDIPMASRVWLDAPSIGGVRSGMVTAPAFMHRYNNFRSRVRALSDALLCKDIDPSLNTDGITTLVNPDHSALDLSVAARSNCASCHYAMDNMGATLFGWNDLGIFTRWPSQLSQLGHVFGQQGTGPQFLMESIVQRGPGFGTCMAKKAWESFSGKSWEVLGDSERSQFQAAASGGPRDLLHAVFLSDALRGARNAAAPESSGSGLSFASDIDPILQASCALSGCHGYATPLGAAYQYVANEDRFRQVPIGRINDGTMPPPSSGLTISDENRQKLIDFLSK